MNDPDLSLIQPVSLYLAENIPVATLDPVDMMVDGLKGELFNSGWYIQSNGFYCYKIGEILPESHLQHLETAFTTEQRVNGYEMLLLMDVEQNYKPIRIWNPTMLEQNNYIDLEDKGNEYFTDKGIRHYPNDYESYILYLRAENEVENGL